MELFGTRSALLIGTSRPVWRPGVPGRAAEFTDLRQVLANPDIGGYARVEVMLEKDVHEVSAALSGLCQRAREAETLLIHYAGSGFIDPSGNLQLMMPGSDPARPSSALSLQFVVDTVGASSAYGAVVLVDVGDGVGLRREEGAGIRRPETADHVAVLAMRPSPEGDDRRPSVTRLLTQGLESGDADVDGDGLVEVNDLYRYLHRAGGQEPEFLHSVESPLVIAQVRPRLVIPTGSDVRNLAPEPVRAKGPERKAARDDVPPAVSKAPPRPEPAAAAEAVRTSANRPASSNPFRVAGPAQAPVTPPPQNYTPPSTPPPSNYTPPSTPPPQMGPRQQQAPPQNAVPPPSPAVDDDVEWVNDAPARDDLLQRGALADVLALRLSELHRDEPDTSVLLHVDGAWGTGKSSLLNLLEDRLAGEFLVARFDAWQQSRLAPPWWTLLTATRTEVVRSRNVFARCWLRFTETVARARRSGAPYLLALLVVLAVTGLAGWLLWPKDANVKSVYAVVQLLGAVVAPLTALAAGALVAGRFLLWDSARGAKLFEQSDSNPMTEVAAHFSWLIDRSPRPLVFFVDDLDRCHQEYVVEFLEAVQTLVRRFPNGRARQTAHFVVAADGAWLRRSYEVAYEKFDESVAVPARPLGYLFLDKLFQLTVPMPELSRTTQAGYLDRMLRIAAGDGDGLAADVREAREAISSHPNDEYVILETLERSSPAVRDQIKGDAAVALAQPHTRRRTNHSLRKFAVMLDPNPRSMKKFLNTYSMLRSVRTLEGNTVATDTLALWSILQIRWPALAQHLAGHPDTVTAIAIADPVRIDEVFPERLRGIAADQQVRAVAGCTTGGPLTPELIRQCRGAVDPAG